MTVDEAAGLWVEQVLRQIKSEKTRRVYLSSLQTVVDALGGVKISDMTSAIVADYVAEMVKAGYAAQTIKIRVQLLRRLHDRAREFWGVQVQQIRWTGQTPRIDNARSRHIDGKTLSALCAELPSGTAAAVRFAYLTGLRGFEQAALKAKDIDWERGLISGVGKGGRRFALELSSAAMAILDGLSARGMSPDEPVFDMSNKNRRLAQACRDIGLDDFRWHDLRHSFATELYDSGADDIGVQQAMRHRSSASTRRYVHVKSGKVRAVVDRLSDQRDRGDA